MTIIDETTTVQEEADKPPSYDYYGTSILGDATSTTTTTTTTTSTSTANSVDDVFHQPTTVATLVDDTADNINDFYSTAENNTNNSNKLPTAFENPYDDPDISIASADDDDDLDDGMNIDDDAMTKNEDDDSSPSNNNNSSMREKIRKIVCTPAGVTGIVLVLFVIIVAIAGAIKSDEDHDSSYYNDNDHNYYSSSQTMYGTDDYLGLNNNSEAYLNATSNNRNDTDTYRGRGGGARTTSHGIFYVRRPSSGRVGGGSSAGRLSGTAGGTSYGGRGGTSSSGSSSSGGGGGSCFPAGQQVLLEGQREQVPIENVQPGSVLHLGGRVAAVMKLPALLHQDPLYRYNNSVLVTGSHLVNENGDWMPVEKSQLAVPLYGDHDDGSTEPPPPPRFVYNLITANHRMVVNNATVFADWEEWEDCEENWGLERQILDRLNNNNNNPGRRFDARRPTASSRSAGASAAAITHDDSTAITEGAFWPGTPVLLHDGLTVPIQNIQPGDRLYNDDPEGVDKDDANKDNRVFAVMKLWVPKNTKMYRYRNSKRNNASVTVTEWTIVLDDDGIWRNAKYSSNSQLVGKTAGSRRGGGTTSTSSSSASEDYWYQLWTTTHRVPVTAAGVVFADYHVIDEDDPIFAEQC